MSEAQDGPIVKPLPPELVYDHAGNVEMRWEAMSEGGDVTPNDRFYVRNHGSTPKIDVASSAGCNEVYPVVLSSRWCTF